jgi:DNA-3-methyladenine glycosylase II
MIPRYMTAEEYARARRALMRRDPVLATIIRRHGPCRLGATRDRFDHFAMLVRAIVFQQLSTKAATTIHDRLLLLMPGDPSPERLAAVDDEQLRRAGISRQKASYLRDLCEKVSGGVVPLESVDGMSDEEVIAALTAIKGVGRWTAEMFLIFHLMRPNVMPLDDLGLIKGISLNYFSGEPVSRAEAREVGEAWAPFRSVATWYIWRSLDPLPVDY